MHTTAQLERVSPLAGKPAAREMFVDIGRLDREYYARKPNVGDPTQCVAFGTSGHCGSSFSASFNEAHILAITQAVCDHRREQGIDGPLYLGKDTHALSGPAERTAIGVLAANGVTTIIQRDDGVTPTPITWAILVHNPGRQDRLADGIVITPSHNPPEDGGFKYNPPNGGPADVNVTGWIQQWANGMLRDGPSKIKRMPFEAAAKAPTTPADLVLPYVKDLRNVVDMDARSTPPALAPGNDAPIGGLKVAAASDWFAARPSGTENIYKLHGEGFKDEANLPAILDEAQTITPAVLGPA